MPPVEAAIFQVGAEYAWVLRLRDKMTVVEEGVEKSFRMAALSAELAELRYAMTALNAELAELHRASVAEVPGSHQAKMSLVVVGRIDDDGASTLTWRRQARPVEVILWVTGDQCAWALRLRDGTGTIEQSVEDDFRSAAQKAELAELYHVDVDWLRTW